MLSADVGHQRLLNHRIAGERFGRPSDVVRWMGAMQAQDYQQALWAIALRTQSATLEEVEQAIANREIVQTWPMRGTLHFVAAENAKWMLEHLARRRLAADRARQRQLELDESILGRCGTLFHDALQGGGRLTRGGMLRLLEDAHISTAGQRGYHILAYLAQTGLICLGPMQGKEQTFALLDDWVPNARTLSREDALAELAARYFASHGPATGDDLARWAGLTLTDARAGLESVKPGLVSETRDAKQYWSSTDAPDPAPHDLSGAYLLPGFDEYLLGYKDRGDVLAAEHAGRVVPGGNGMFLPMIVAGGQVAGTWKRIRKKSGVEVTLSPFALGSIAAEQVAAAAERFSAFLGVPLSSIVVSEGKSA
jgi:winged helix DNA-binding protein